MGGKGRDDVKLWKADPRSRNCVQPRGHIATALRLACAPLIVQHSSKIEQERRPWHSHFLLLQFPKCKNMYVHTWIGGASRGDQKMLGARFPIHFAATESREVDMNAPQSPSASRPCLLASTAAITALFSTAFPAPAMAMQPVVKDVASEMLVDAGCGGGGNQNQSQVGKPRKADAAKPSALRFIDADMEAVALPMHLDNTFATPAMVMQPVVKNVASEILVYAGCQNQNQSQIGKPRKADAAKPSALRFIDIHVERG